MPRPEYVSERRFRDTDAGAGQRAGGSVGTTRKGPRRTSVPTTDSGVGFHLPGRETMRIQQWSLVLFALGAVAVARCAPSDSSTPAAAASDAGAGPGRVR